MNETDVIAILKLRTKTKIKAKPFFNQRVLPRTATQHNFLTIQVRSPTRGGATRGSARRADPRVAPPLVGDRTWIVKKLCCVAVLGRTLWLKNGFAFIFVFVLSFKIAITSVSFISTLHAAASSGRKK